MLTSYIIGIGCSFMLATIVSFFWVRNIDHMKENHPNYNGQDLFGKFDNNEEDDPDVDYLG